MARSPASFKVALTLYVAALAGMFCWVRSDLIEKCQHEKSDRQIIWAMDWEDLNYFHLLPIVSSLPARVVSVPLDLESKNEQMLRDHFVRVLWKIDDAASWDTIVSRVKPGDGVLLSGENLIDRPFFPKALAGLVAAQNGFVPMMEFSPAKASLTFFRAVPRTGLIKGHAIGTREMVEPNPTRWRVRLTRAVEERGVRLLLVRFSGSWSGDQNLQFQNDVIAHLKERGFSLSVPGEAPVETAHRNTAEIQLRLKLMFLLSIVAPLMALWIVRAWKWKSVVLFGLVSALTTFAGVVIHGLGALPDIRAGLYPMMGIKLQLALPIIIAAGILVTKKEWRSILEGHIRWNHVLWLGGGIVFLGAVYLARSGNTPFLPVSGLERDFRDALEAFFGARPRFKEFFIGHPLFLLGMYAAARDSSKSYFWDGRLFLKIGLIGQISILNTFIHVHSPLSVGLLRTWNGIWIGTLISWPLCALYDRRRQT